MNEKIGFTNRRLADLPVPEKGRSFYLDSGNPESVAGLRCAVSASGVKTFLLVRKRNGKTRFVTIGRFPDISVDTARKLARKSIAMLADGVDPTNEKKAERVRGINLADAFDAYMKDRKLSDNTTDNYNTVMRKYLYDWQDKALRDITRDMVISRHGSITSGTLKPGPDYIDKQMTASASSANKTMRVLRAIYNFAQVRYDDGTTPVITDNPVIKVTRLKKWNKEKARNTRLFDGDLKPWFDAVLSLKEVPDSFDNTVADFLIFLLLTGLRRREAANLKWTDINLRSRFFTVWQTKNGEPHKLPLTDYLLEMMKTRRAAVKGEHVFPGGGKNESLNDPRRQIEFVRGQAGVSFTMHDLRRTFTSVAESLDIPAYALKRLLNHAGGRDVTATHYIVIDLSLIHISEPTRPY